MYKVVRNLGPSIMKGLFVLNDNARSERTFHRPNVNSENNGKSSIRYFGPIVWDEMLPNRLNDKSHRKVITSNYFWWVF